MWKVKKSDMERWVETCPKYQTFKKITNRPYENIPHHKPELLPWRTTHVDLVTPCTVLFKTYDGTNINKTIPEFTEVVSATYWLEIIYIE